MTIQKQTLAKRYTVVESIIHELYSHGLVTDYDAALTLAYKVMSDRRDGR